MAALYLKCDCGRHLFLYFQQNGNDTIYVKPCEKCLEKAFNNGIEKALTEGFDKFVKFLKGELKGS